MPVLHATNGEAVCPVVIVHVRIAAVEVQVVSVITGRYTAPIVAVAIHIVERGIAVVPVARQRKWQFNFSCPVEQLRLALQLVDFLKENPVEVVLLGLPSFGRKRETAFWQKYLADFSKNAIGLIFCALASAVTRGDSGPLFFIFATFPMRQAVWKHFQFFR